MEPTIDHSQGNELETPTISVKDELSQTLTPETPAEPEFEDSGEGEESTDGVAAQAAQAAKKLQEMEEGDGTGEEPPAWQPSFKYKVRETEHEIDEWARPFIKDEETQKKFVDLYTRGHGLELAKQERDEIRTKYENLEQSLGILNGYVQQYYQNPQSGAEAARNFVEALNLPKQMFLQYALQELKYEQLPPEQKAQVDAERQRQIEFNQLQMQNQQLSQQTQSLAVQQRSTELQTALAEPSVAGIANDYDARVGRQGAFFDLVVERGIYHDKVNGKDIPVKQAVTEAIQIIGASIQSAGTQQVPPQTGNVGTQPPVQAQQKKPVLPNISGQGTASPVKRVVNSIDDIRKRHAELTAQGQ